MKNKILFSIIILFFIFCFAILFKALETPNIYIPKSMSEKTLVNFSTKDFFSNKPINSDKIFIGSDFYILNIWASWCLPCREEHSKLIKLSKNKKIKLIGLNYKDKFKNAKQFIEKFGNPYSAIITDDNGIISIELGAYGVPETFLINKDKKILKKFIGPLNEKSIKEIQLLLE
jgi:cytochrome c biogenesis protein CcmG, thiol:disulfide interchange protein DsbE